MRVPPHTRWSRRPGGALVLLLVLWAQSAAARPVADQQPVRIDRDFGFKRGWRAWANQIKAQMDRYPAGTKFIYLSGPISSGGRGNVEANLRYGVQVTQKLRAAGYAVISPFEIESFRIGGTPPSRRLARAMDGFTHATFMKMWSEVARDPRISQICLLPGFETSVGATQELTWFVAAGKPVKQFRETRNGFALKDHRYHPVTALVEHTLLKPEATAEDVQREARFAGSHGFRAMVVRPEHISAVAAELKGTPTIPTSVVGFPDKKFTRLAVRGTEGWARVPTAQKIADARRAIDGARQGGARQLELDMILDVHTLKAASAATRRGDHVRARALYGRVKADVNQVIAAARTHGTKAGVSTKVKVIVETSVLTRRELQLASAIVRDTGALSVKTSTGYGPRGASERDLRVIQGVVGSTKLIKASGGVTGERIDGLKRLGAHIFGMSRSRDLVR